MGAVHHQLGNLTALVDINALQADGPTAGVLSIEPIHDKWTAFGWSRPARRRQRRRRRGRRSRRTPTPPPTSHGQPSVVLCDTKVGYGVPLLENREKAHFMRIDEHEWQICRDQLSSRRTGRIRTDEHQTAPAPKLKTSAMIASFADPGQKTTPAPFGHALVKAAAADDRIVGLQRRPGQVHRHAHLRPGDARSGSSSSAWPSSCSSAPRPGSPKPA